MKKGGKAPMKARGATDAFRRTQHLAAICEMGRWGEVRTARIYLEGGELTAIEAAIPDLLMNQLTALARTL